MCDQSIAVAQLLFLSSPLVFVLFRSALIMYSQILDAIEKNDYDNFSKRAYVSKLKKLSSLPRAFLRATFPPRS